MNIIIDGRACEALHGEYILGVARRNGIEIPALCHNDALSGIGSCRLCIVEVIEGGKTKIAASCLYPVTGELEVRTCSEKLVIMRKTIMNLLLERTSYNEHLKRFAEKYNIYSPREERLTQNKEDCIICGLCVKACEKLGNSAISTVGRGIGKKVAPPYEEPPDDCIGCGSCASVCPTGAITLEEGNGIRTIWGKSFEMMKCKKCGKYFETRDCIEHVKKRLQEKEETEYCSSCRRIAAAEKFKDIYGI